MFLIWRMERHSSSPTPRDDSFLWGAWYTCLKSFWMFFIVFSVPLQFARVPYTKAIELLKTAVEEGHVFEEMVLWALPICPPKYLPQNAYFSDQNIEWGMDMGSEHERYLCEVVGSQFASVFDFVTWFFSEIVQATNNCYQLPERN